MLYYNRIDLGEEKVKGSLLKVAAVKNEWFITIDFLIMGLNIKILFAMIVMIC